MCPSKSKSVATGLTLTDHPCRGVAPGLTFIYPSSSAARGLPVTDHPSRCVAMFLALSVHPPRSVSVVLTLPRNVASDTVYPPPPQECCYDSDTIPQGVFFWQCLSPQEYCYGSDTVMSGATVLTQYTPPPWSVATVLTLSVYPLPWVLLQF